MSEFLALLPIAGYNKLKITHGRKVLQTPPPAMTTRSNLIAMSSDHTTVYIYKLIDPRDGLVRYVGQTSDPDRRLKEHIDKSNPYCNRFKHEWIDDLKQQGLAPIMQIIQEVNQCVGDRVEAWWIDYFRKRGYPMLNIAMDTGLLQTDRRPLPRPFHRSRLL